jgi:hypothetical protein
MSTSDLSGSWTFRRFNPAFVSGNQTAEENTIVRFADDAVMAKFRKAKVYAFMMPDYLT